MDLKTGSMRITVVGAGGTGCALLPLLATMQPALMRVVDGDTVEPANLSRQPLYGAADVGRPKATTALGRLAHLQGEGAYEAQDHFLDAANAHALLAGSSVVADCTDDLHARLLLDRMCGSLDIPLVVGAVHGHQVQVYTLHVPLPGRPQGLGLRDWFPGQVGMDQDGCDMRTVPAAVTTLAAARMAQRISAVLQGQQQEHAAHMDVIDTLHGGWMRFRAPHPTFNDELIA